MNYNSFFGFIALTVYITTLIPSNLVKIFPHTKRWRIIQLFLRCNHRRFLGLTTFALAINHALISIAKYNIDFFKLTTYAHYYTGVSTLLIFTILAITSNNWSIRKLKKKWKHLHQLTYVAMFLLLWHILSLMSDSWTWLTPIALHLITATILIYLTRLVFISVVSITTIKEIQEEQIYNQIRILQILPERSKQQNAIAETREVTSLVKIGDSNLSENE